jgi:pilus assembly protein Flp/PilA
MKALMSAMQAFVRDQDGVTAIEYGLIAAAMAAAIGTAMVALSGGLSTVFTTIVTALT